jgi:hypothetical protein
MLRRTLVGIAIALVVLAFGGIARRAEASAHATESSWSYDYLMDRLHGATVAVARKRYKIDRTMVVCNGVGRPAVRGGVRRWRRFTCTQTIFGDGMIRDITFGVRPLGRLRFSVVYARYGP